MPEPRKQSVAALTSSGASFPFCLSALPRKCICHQRTWHFRALIKSRNSACDLSLRDQACGSVSFLSLHCLNSYALLNQNASSLFIFQSDVHKGHFLLLLFPEKECKHICCCSVALLCLSLCNLMDCSTPGFPVLHQFLELAQTRVGRVSNAIQPSHPLLSPFPPAFNISQHQGLFH